MFDLSRRGTQAEFAELVGISQQRVGQLVAEAVLPADATLHFWLDVYLDRLREQAAGRDQILTIERTALARSQRIGQDIRNAEAQATFAPVALLAEILTAASAMVVERLDELPGRLQDACPGLPPEASGVIARTVASARAEWVRGTAALNVRGAVNLDDVDVDDSTGT